MLGRVSLSLYVCVQAALTRSRDEEGQTLAEYGLIMSVVAVAVIVAALAAFRDNIMGAFNLATDCLDRTTC